MKVNVIKFKAPEQFPVSRINIDNQENFYYKNIFNFIGLTCDAWVFCKKDGCSSGGSMSISSHLHVQESLSKAVNVKLLPMYVYANIKMIVI